MEAGSSNIFEAMKETEKAHADFVIKDNKFYTWSIVLTFTGMISFQTITGLYMESVFSSINMGTPWQVTIISNLLIVVVSFLSLHKVASLHEKAIEAQKNYLTTK